MRSFATLSFCTKNRLWWVGCKEWVGEWKNQTKLHSCHSKQASISSLPRQSKKNNQKQQQQQQQETTTKHPPPARTCTYTGTCTCTCISTYSPSCSHNNTSTSCTCARTCPISTYSSTCSSCSPTTPPPATTTTTRNNHNTPLPYFGMFTTCSCHRPVPWAFRLWGAAEIWRPLSKATLLLALCCHIFCSKIKVIHKDNPTPLLVDHPLEEAVSFESCLSSFIHLTGPQGLSKKFPLPSFKTKSISFQMSTPSSHTSPNPNLRQHTHVSTSYPSAPQPAQVQLSCPHLSLP